MRRGSGEKQEAEISTDRRDVFLCDLCFGLCTFVMMGLSPVSSVSTFITLIPCMITSLVGACSRILALSPLLFSGILPWLGQFAASLNHWEGLDVFCQVYANRIRALQPGIKPWAISVYPCEDSAIAIGRVPPWRASNNGADESAHRPWPFAHLNLR